MNRSDTLAEALLAAVRAQDFGNTADSEDGGRPLRRFPSIDLAVAAFPADGAAPAFANVLFSREHPQGQVAAIDAEAGGVHGLRFDRDPQDAAGESAAWRVGADWTQMTWLPLAGDAAAPRRFVAPYPASLLKLMVAVGVGMAVDRGLTRIPDALEPMIVISDNAATDECVALLHRVALLGARNGLNEAFAARGLHTLQINQTTAAGGWRNGDGAGVGHVHMTAWDTVRLLWLLDADAPPAPWLRAITPPLPPLLSPAMRDQLRGVLTRQQLDEVLSSGSLRGQPGWVPGLPDAPTFAHKTGTTDNYASDAGIVRTTRCHYLVAVLTSLGRRYAATPVAATTWRLPALGAAVHAAVEALT